MTFHFPLTGEMQRPDVRPHQVRQPFISRSRARCNVEKRNHLRYVPFISRSRARCNTAMADASKSRPSFHFPLTGEMQLDALAIVITLKISFISRSRARCNRGRCSHREPPSLSFPAHGRDATADHNGTAAKERLSFPAHGRDATGFGNVLRCAAAFISRSRARCNDGRSVSRLV